MRETVEEAEVAEPLLAQKLYDSFRKTNQQQVDRKLAETGQLLTQGFEAQAREREQAAAEGERDKDVTCQKRKERPPNS